MELAIKYCSKCEIELNNVTHRVKANKNWCDSCRNEWRTANYRKNKERLDKKQREWRLANPEKVAATRKKHRISNESARELYKSDELYRLAKLTRNRVRSACRAKGLEKTMKFVSYIGCTVQRLKEHVESKFQPGMTWENQNEWHLDHIVPLSSANTIDELNKLAHFTNIQPLWAVDNLKKGKKYA